MSGPVSVAPWGIDTGPGPQSSAFARLWRGFSNARIAIAAVTLVLLLALFSVQPGSAEQGWLIVFCACYLLATLLARVLARPPRRHFGLVWLLTIGTDLAAIATLEYFQAGGVNFSPLLAAPVLMASVLGSRSLAFGTAAAVSLLLLADAWLRNFGSFDWAPPYVQAGLTGLGYFALAFLANHLSGRLAREEQKALQSEEAARLQSQVNELVIETLADGVLVVDADGRVRAANPTACSLLGHGSTAAGFMLSDQSDWEELLALAQRTIDLQANQVSEALIGGAREPQTRVLVRTRLAGTDAEGSLCVVFLEDLRELEARLRTEKLASMGRMSAAVAHEIRNPLAAIAQANALLAEELTDPGQRQLSAMVQQNAQRLALIVDDVLDVARVRQQGQPSATLLALGAAATGTCRDWARQTGNEARLRLALRATQAHVRFEPDHLRRVLVNLLDNAARHANAETASIQVATTAAGSQVRLLVWSDGPPLEPTVQRHLFEPFFSSESRSSGLGLYICRELCERHGAQIGYRRWTAPLGGTRQGNEFFIDFRTAPRNAPGAAAPARIQA